MTVLTREELLIILIEECAEVSKAATKCLRFGWDRNYPGYGINHKVLAGEYGELMAVADALKLDRDEIILRKMNKIARARRAKEEFGAENS